MKVDYIYYIIKTTPHGKFHNGGSHTYGKRKKVLVALIKNLYAEPNFSDVNANEISDMTDIPTKSVRGTLSSLVKKGYIEVDKSLLTGSEPTVYLHISKWYLHPNWKTSSEYESWCKSI